jgi:hypothetical protein
MSVMPSITPPMRSLMPGVWGSWRRETCGRRELDRSEVGELEADRVEPLEVRLARGGRVQDRLAEVADAVLGLADRAARAGDGAVQVRGLLVEGEIGAGVLGREDRVVERDDLELSGPARRSNVAVLLEIERDRVGPRGDERAAGGHRPVGHAVAAEAHRALVGEAQVPRDAVEALAARRP